MPNKEIFVLKIVWKKSIASLHRLTQAVQRANLRRMAGDPTWVWDKHELGSRISSIMFLSQFPSVILFRTNMNWGQEYVILIGHVPLQAIAYPMFSM